MGVTELSMGSKSVRILVSCGCCDKLPQFFFYFPTVLEARSPKSVSLGPNQDVAKAIPPWEAFLRFFQFLVAASIP